MAPKWSTWGPKRAPRDPRLLFTCLPAAFGISCFACLPLASLVLPSLVCMGSCLPSLVVLFAWTQPGAGLITGALV